MKLTKFTNLKSLMIYSLIIICPFSFAQEKQNTKKIKVACIGNSITFGAGIEDRYKDSYPAILERMLGDGYEVVNFGNSGTTMLMKGDYPYRNEKTFQDAIDYNPDIVIIKLGTNDSKPKNWKYKKEFEKDYCDFINSFRKISSNPKIFICKPVPAYQIQWGINDSIIRNEIIPVIEKIAAEKSVPVIDLNKALSNRAEAFPDKIHPNKEGAILIAKEVYKSITGKTAEFSDQPYPGKRSTWRGFDAFTFYFEGRESIIVAPKKIAPGKPWIWRAMFFDHEPQTDSAFLERGYHVAFIEVTHLYGGARAVRFWDNFYTYLTKVHGFSKRTILEGLSRAGLIVFSWTSKNPEKVSTIYVDAPVCDIKSWPGPKHPMWKDCLKELKITEADVSNYKGNPIDILEPLAKAGIPILSICGDSDSTVPYKDNTAVLAKRYIDLGGEIKVILKPGVNHHPHSLKDPTPIVDFILQHQK